MTDRQIIDVLENTDGLMVSTEDEKAYERSRDCTGRERWNDNTYKRMTGTKRFKVSKRHIPLSW